MNAYASILVTPSGITISVRELQPENVYAVIVVMPLGREMLVNLSQLTNAPSSMYVTLSGITMFSRFVHP